MLLQVAHGGQRTVDRESGWNGLDVGRRGWDMYAGERTYVALHRSLDCYGTSGELTMCLLVSSKCVVEVEINSHRSGIC